MEFDETFTGCKSQKKLAASTTIILVDKPLWNRCPNLTSLIDVLKRPFVRYAGSYVLSNRQERKGKSCT